MDRVSSTSSSKATPWPRFALRALIFLVSVFLMDALIYFAVYPWFNDLHKLGAIEERSDAVVVGSSHVFWDIDVKFLSQATGREFAMLSVPGGNMEIRRHLVEEYFERHGESPPALIILETDKYSFHAERYPAGAFRPLIGYYHKGILREYLAEKMAARDLYVERIFRTCSLNGVSYFIGARIYNRAGAIGKQIAKVFGVEWESQDDTPIFDLGGTPAGGGAPVDASGAPGTPADDGEDDVGDGPNAEEAPATVPGEDPRLQLWREQYAKYSPEKISAGDVAEFGRIIALAQQHPQTTFVLLETPNILLFPERDAGFEEHVRAVFREAADQYENVKYVRLAPEVFESEAELYFDGSHMNFEGRVQYTQALLAEVRGLLR